MKGSYSKGRLARMNYPGVDGKSASRRLMRDIWRCKALSEKVQALDPGFRWRRSLTISMTKLIIEYRGDPEETYEE